MNRASPGELRRALVAAQEFVKAGILFVPMPVLNNADRDSLANQMQNRLQMLEEQAAKDEGEAA